MATLHDIRQSVAERTPTAPPSWVNAELGTLGPTILHSGGGELVGSWHSQDSDEMLLVLDGACEVDTTDGTVRATAGEIIQIRDGEPHRVRTEPGTLLVAIESSTAKRTSLAGPAS